jgi:hypothetical protein
MIRRSGIHFIKRRSAKLLAHERGGLSLTEITPPAVGEGEPDWTKGGKNGTAQLPGSALKR